MRHRVTRSTPLASDTGCSVHSEGAGNIDDGVLMEYTITAAFLLAVVAGSFAAVIFGGYGIAHLIASAL